MGAAPSIKCPVNADERSRGEGGTIAVNVSATHIASLSNHKLRKAMGMAWQMMVLQAFLLRTVGPMSRNQLSFCGRAMTCTLSGSRRRADSTCSGLAHTVTGSNAAMAEATAAKAVCAGTAPSRQLSGLGMATRPVGFTDCGAITLTCRASPSTFVHEAPTLLAYA